MTVYVLLSTIDGGLSAAAQVLLPPADGVRYVVCWQQTHPSADNDPAVCEAERLLLSRSDVRLSTMEGRGLCRSRNRAIATALEWQSDPLDDDIFVIADDDERFLPDAFVRLREIYTRHPRLDSALMRLRSSSDGSYFKAYPDAWVDYRHRPRSYYPASWEITFRSRVCQLGIRFDERFGLGAEALCAGEEDVLLETLVRHGLNIYIVPVDLGTTDPVTTGSRVLDVKVLRSKGAVYGYTRPLWRAFLRSYREAVALSIRHHASPFRLFNELWYGVKYIRLCPTS